MRAGPYLSQTRIEKSSPLQNKRFLIPVVYILFLVLGIPWYLPPELTTLILGFPLWVCVSLLVVVIASVFTAWLYLVEFADDEP